MGAAQLELQLVKERRYDFTFHRQAAKWSQVGDRVTEEFFRITGPRPSRVGIRRLRRPDGSLASEPEDVRELATSFYRELLSAEAPLTHQLACRQEVWRHARRVVSSEMQDALLSPLTCEELPEALRALPSNSCPGQERLGLSFLMQHWELVGPGLLVLF